MMTRSEAIYKATSTYEKEYPNRMIYCVYVTERLSYFEINIKSRIKTKKLFDDDVTIWKQTEKEE